MIYLFQTTDPLGRSVRMTQDTLNVHLLAERNRSEFYGHWDAIKLTIDAPHAVIRSNKNPQSDVYFRLGAHPEQPKLFVKVPVLFKFPDEGVVSTAILVKDMVQGTESPGGIKYVNYRR